VEHHDAGSSAAIHRSVRGAPVSGARAILLMILSAGIISINDAAMKWIVADMPVGEAIFLRGVMSLALFAVFLPRLGGRDALRWRSAAGQLVCAACFTAALFLYIFSITVLPLAAAAVMVFTSPLWVTLLAPLVLGERVGWWRRGAVLLGFAGAAIAMQPGGADFQWMLILPLLAGLLDAVRDLVTRRIIARESSGSLLLTAFATVTAASACTLPLGWIVPDAGQLGLLAFATLCFAGGLFLMLEAIRGADISLVSPFRFSALLWVALLGFAVWGDVPSSSMMLGAAFIVAGGLIIVHRERRRPPPPANRSLDHVR
jgi:drug/metabolite transporter (DMT)-like permease